MTVTITPGSDSEAQIWATTLEVSRLFADLPWILIGATMVMLLEHEAGRPSGRTTGDVDVVVDLRVVAGGIREAVDLLVAAGFDLESAEHPYRFVRGASQVDVLAPDHLGPHADLTTIPPATTTQIPGGSRALASRRSVAVDIDGVGTGALPIPSLGGALALKIRAWQARHAERDAADLVRLLSLVSDVEPIRRALKPAERSALGRVTPLTDGTHRVWRTVADPEDAQAAFARISA